ncbi:MAG TPA: hypothetical protein PKE00_14930, partial [Planctomycetota bacterium]|nr:hypothetical protein [Planctomycetota bacterium]
SFWVFIVIALSIFAVVEVIGKIAAASREVRIARIEADLKRDLVDRLGDPALVARVVEAKFSGTLQNGKGSKVTDAAGAQVVFASAGAPTVQADGKAAGSGLLFVGLIATFIGSAFLVLAGTVDDDFVIPGVLLLAGGLAFLVYPTARDEIARARSQASTQAAAARSGE